LRLRHAWRSCRRLNCLPLLGRRCCGRLVPLASPHAMPSSTPQPQPPGEGRCPPGVLQACRRPGVLLRSRCSRRRSLPAGRAWCRLRPPAALHLGLDCLQQLASPPGCRWHLSQQAPTCHPQLMWRCSRATRTRPLLGHARRMRPPTLAQCPRQQQQQQQQPRARQALVSGVCTHRTLPAPAWSCCTLVQPATAARLLLPCQILQ
jgi:hypothetical protein